MNKLLIVLLAVCLVSVHAFVKRDAPEAVTTDLQKQLNDLQAKVLEVGKNLSEQAAIALDPTALQKKLDELINTAKEALDKIKPADAAKPAA